MTDFFLQTAQKIGDVIFSIGFVIETRLTAFASILTCSQFVYPAVYAYVRSYNFLAPDESICSAWFLAP